MTSPRILATSGGFVPGPTQMTARVGPMLLDALASTKKARPRVCLVHTASGDEAMYYAISYEAFNAAGCDVTEVKLFPQPSPNAEERLASADLVWVGGGSVANLLALWRLHHVDEAMRVAWEAGVILAGVSAGSICWHLGGTTDSFGPTLAPVSNALGFLPYANGVHYDSEAQRRPLLHQLVAEGTFESAYASDDKVGIWYEGTQATRVVGDVASGPGAYLIEREAGVVRETRVEIGASFS